MSNPLVNSHHYNFIIGKYKTLISLHGIVNLREFHAEVVAPLIPNYTYESFRRAIKRINDENKEIQQNIQGALMRKEAGTAKNLTSEEDASVVPVPAQAPAPTLTEDQVNRIVDKVGLTTGKGIALSVAIGEETLKKIKSGEIPMGAKDKVELLFKAMKAQDSRAAIATKMRADNREQAAFDRAFGKAAYL